MPPALCPLLNPISSSQHTCNRPRTKPWGGIQTWLTPFSISHLNSLHFTSSLHGHTPASRTRPQVLKPNHAAPFECCMSVTLIPLQLFLPLRTFVVHNSAHGSNSIGPDLITWQVQIRLQVSVNEQPSLPPWITPSSTAPPHFTSTR